ncbi:MAG: VacJ family lipoprotein [Haliea sp.]
MALRFTPCFRGFLLSTVFILSFSTVWAADLPDGSATSHAPILTSDLPNVADADAVAGTNTLIAAPADIYDETNDPIESFNRVMFDINEALLNGILKPLTKLYQAVLPDPLEQGIANALHNVRSPVIFLHDVLQGEWERANITARRFFLNTTLGLGGLIDLGDHAGMPRHREDLGQTLAVWGMPEGPYLVVPLLGPSNPRDLIGRIVDGYIDPVTILAENTGHEEGNYVRLGLTAVNEYGAVMNELQEIKKTSIDYYASIRSLYRQKRNAEIRNGRDQQLPPVPDFLSYEYEEPTVTGSSTVGSHPGLMPGLLYVEPQELSGRMAESAD